MAKIEGLPRTANAASKAGHKPVAVRHNELATSFALTPTKRHGILASISPDPGGNGTIVCYYNSNTGNNDLCYLVPKT